jgi:amidohydrolase
VSTTIDTGKGALPSPRASVQSISDELIAIRRDIHQHAELSTEEHRTQRVITERLREIGIDDVRASADTGVTALVRGGRPGPNLLWRADIDGLPLVEETGLPFASQAHAASQTSAASQSAMHACGHDGHIAIALGLATILHQHRDELAGSVRFAFQPAEEHVGGARRMIAEGILDDPPVERLFGLHLWAQTPLGVALVKAGPVFAAATHFRITIRGRGGHAASPHETVDPIVVAAHVIVALQTVVSRSVDPSETAVFSIGRVQGGVRGNVIPNECWMSGTIRTYEARVLSRMLARIEEILGGVTAAWGGSYAFEHSTLTACVNDADSAAIVERAAVGLLGEDNVAPGQTTGADDMNLFLEARPGAYFMLGARPRGSEHVYPHHHPKFDFDEAAIPLGVELALRIVEEAMGTSLA